MSSRKITYTSTLPDVVIEGIVEYAKKKKISKNRVIELAVKKLLEEEIRNELIESFKKIAEDHEITEMADWGLEDYVNQLKKTDK